MASTKLHQDPDVDRRRYNFPNLTVFRHVCRQGRDGEASVLITVHRQNWVSFDLNQNRQMLRVMPAWALDNVEKDVAECLAGHYLSLRRPANECLAIG